MSIQQVAVDAFGNTIGQKIGAGILKTSSVTFAAGQNQQSTSGSQNPAIAQRYQAAGFDPIMQAYDYMQSYPQSSMTFGNALEYYGDQAASPYRPSLIADPQIVGSGRMRNGLYQSEWSRYTDWDSGARAIQVLQHDLPVGMALPLLGAAQSGFDQARASLREQYALIEAKAANPLTAVLGRLGRVVGEGAYDFVDGFRNLATLATDDKSRRMTLARGAYAITNHLETAREMVIGGANYFRNSSAEKMGEDALRFAVGGVGGVLSAGAGKVFSAAGSFAVGSDVVASRLAGSAASRAVIDVLETPGLQGSPSVALHTRGTGMLTGAASYDQLFIESPQAIITSQVDRYYPSGYSTKFSSSPTMGGIFGAMESGLKP